MSLCRDARDLACAVGSVLVSTVLELHSLFVEREECGAWSDYHDGTESEVGDQIRCDLPFGHRGGHASREHGLDVDRFQDLRDHGVDAPRSLQ